MSETDWSALLTTWRVGGQAPTPAVLAMGVLVGRAARIAGGTQLRIAEERAQAQALVALQTAQATANAQAATTAAASCLLDTLVGNGLEMGASSVSLGLAVDLAEG